MNDKHIHQALDNIGKRHMPDTVNILPAIEERIMRHKQRHASIGYQHPVKLVASLIACLLLVVTTVYAVTRLIVNDPALEESMLTELNLSQTQDDTTVTLTWAYADANRISIGYTISGEYADTYPENTITPVEITDANQRRYVPLSAIYLERDEAGNIFANFSVETGVIEDTPETIALQARILEDFVFDFSVPFIEGITIDAMPDVNVNGVNLNLEWAMITPSMTRVHLCYEAPGDEFWVPGNFQLSFDGERVATDIGAHHAPYGAMEYGEDGRWCRSHVFFTRYQQLPDQIRLTVSHIQTPHNYSEENMQRMAEIYAKYGIEATVRENTVVEGSYLLSFASLPDDYLERERIAEEARQNMGAPLKGERIEGPWVITIDLDN